MTQGESIIERLRAAGCVFAEDEAALLIATATGEAELATMVRDRVSGIPLEHVLGWVEFYGRRYSIGPGVFVPRPRTEFLVRQAVERAPRGGVLLDLCCGSGAVGAAIAARTDAVELHSSDSDPVTVDCARENVSNVYLGDLYRPLPESLRGRVDVLVVIAPYVPTSQIALLPHEARDFEPATALDGGADGLELLRRVVAGAREWLAPGGFLITEVAATQAPTLSELVAAAGLTPTVIRDEDSSATVVVGRYA